MAQYDEGGRITSTVGRTASVVLAILCLGGFVSTFFVDVDPPQLRWFVAALMPVGLVAAWVLYRMFNRSS